jgi:hypothetical protein
MHHNRVMHDTGNDLGVEAGLSRYSSVRLLESQMRQNFAVDVPSEIRRYILGKHLELAQLFYQRSTTQVK